MTRSGTAASYIGGYPQIKKAAELPPAASWCFPDQTEAGAASCFARSSFILSTMN
jgi:hypothetical protein